MQKLERSGLSIESDHKCLSDEAIRAEIAAIDKLHASEEYLNWLYGKEEE